MKICAIIPSHNHYTALGAVVQALQQQGLPVFIIDDGSDEPARSALAAFHNPAAAFHNPAHQIIVEHLSFNQGKGVAVMHGFHVALDAGFTHALQIDADGQHDVASLPALLEAAKMHPEALISGAPHYDASIPLGRKIGRWITHIWVWIETLSFRITDSMCGFRIYPLKPVQSLMAREKIGHHMDFDTDIMVRLFWRGVAPVMVPVRVTYPVGNISNFKMLRDNWRITKMHTRLFLTMITRLPSIMEHRPPCEMKSNHWSQLVERGGLWGLRFCASAYRLLGRKGCQIVLAPIVFYFFVTGIEQRRTSHQFLARALHRMPSWREMSRQYMNFAMRALDVLIAWSGDMPPDAIQPTNSEVLASIMAHKRGGLILVAHIGNVDVARALLDRTTRERMTILVHTRHAENYNRIIQQFRPDAAMNMLQVTEIGPATIIDLQQRIEKGEWIVMAADRTSVLAREHSLYVPFLGAIAPFPQGPWILGALLECPVYLFFCMRQDNRYYLTMEKFAETIILSRQSRQQDMQTYATDYAKRLEHYVAVDPFQWYNFFDFWAQ